jgi:hypothetical protein
MTIQGELSDAPFIVPFVVAFGIVAFPARIAPPQTSRASRSGIGSAVARCFIPSRNEAPQPRVATIGRNGG